MGSFCKHQGLPRKTDSDQRQTINQSCFMGFSLGTMDPLPRSRPWDESTVSRLSFPDSGKATKNFKDFPTFLLTHCFLGCWNTWRYYQTRLRTAELVSPVSFLLPASVYYLIYLIGERQSGCQTLTSNTSAVSEFFLRCLLPQNHSSPVPQAHAASDWVSQRKACRLSVSLLGEICQALW